MRLIDKEELLNIFLKWRKIDIELHGKELEWEPSLVLRAVNEAPEVDVAPVVRCRECKSHGTLKSGELFCGKIKTGIYGYYHTVKADDYCSYGERKEDRK